MERTGVRLLWGTANLFSHPRYAAGAATNPDPDVFAVAVAQVGHALEATHALGGANYVLWGGREGYETLLNTDLARAEAQMARFLHLVVEHKHRIGFEGTILIEPKPAEPTKHQYDHDAATVVGFLERHGLAGEVRLNLEANHATLAGHSFHHEVATAVAAGRLRIDRRQPRRPPERMGHRPVPQLGGGVHARPLRDPGRRRLHHRRRQLRHQAAPPVGGPGRPVPRPHRGHGHHGPVPAGRRLAARVGRPGPVPARSATPAGTDRWVPGSWTARVTLADLRTRVEDDGLDPTPRSGRQELLEHVVNRHVERAR